MLLLFLLSVLFLGVGFGVCNGADGIVGVAGVVHVVLVLWRCCVVNVGVVVMVVVGVGVVAVVVVVDDMII